MNQETRTQTIAGLNDTFRHSTQGITVTSGVQELDDLLGLLAAVRHFNTFTEDNDPYGEHDFGSLVHGGEKIFWKIDYYDQNLQYGEDPISPKCKRVLTIMLANEY